MSAKNNELLINASDIGDLATVKKLLAIHVSPNDHVKYGNSALILAVEGEHFDIASELIRFGADVNYENDAGDNPLISAVVSGNKKMVELILTSGVIINKENRFGVTPIEYAIHYKNKDIIELLENAQLKGTQKSGK